MCSSDLWRLDAERETWLLVLNGSARAGSISVASGDAIFAQSDDIKIKVGSTGVVALVAYKGMGGPVPHLLNLPVSRISKEKGPTEAAQLPP